MLAFAGTNDLDDWIDDIWQGLGWDSPQYVAAMQIASSLAGNANMTDLIATGHSLGGGLASAAAVVGAIPTDTFNAAGLHINTLYPRDGMGNLLTDNNGNYIEIYQGSLARFNNAGGLINAHYVDWDLLSAVQDNTPLYNALGFRIMMDGPYDTDMAFAFGSFSASFLASQPWAAAYAAVEGVVTMVNAHLMPAVLYGLLTEDILGYDL